MLKRSEARATYDRALRAQLQDFRAAAKTALTAEEDIFSFAGDFSAVRSAYQKSHVIMYRRRAIDPHAPLTLSETDQTLWARLSREQSRRLAALRLVILPLERVGFRTNIKLKNLPSGPDKTLSDPFLKDAIRDNLAAAVRGLRLKTELAVQCSRGVKLTPLAKVRCYKKGPFNLCSLEVGGVIEPCKGSTRKAEFWVTGLNGATEGDDFDRLKGLMLKRLGHATSTQKLADKLQAHLPVQQFAK